MCRPCRFVLAGALLLLSLDPRDACSGWTQPGFLIGGFFVGRTHDPDRLIRLNDAGLDFVVNSDQGSPQVAAAFGSRLDSLAGAHAGFDLQALIYHEDYSFPGSLFKNRNPVANQQAILGQLALPGLNNGSVLGWNLWDEPPLFYGSAVPFYPADSIYWSIHAMTALIRGQADTRTKLPFVSMLPIHSKYYYPPPCSLETDDVLAYRCYLDKYLALFDGDSLPAPLISFCNYPFETPTADLARYCLQLAVTRDKAAQYSRANYRIPFWSVIQAAPRRENDSASYEPTPTLNQIRWQAYVSLAYGAKGIVYFTSHPWQSTDPHYPVGYGPAFLKDDGTVNGTLYTSLQSLNAELHAIGPTLMTLDPVATYHSSTGGFQLPLGEDVLTNPHRACDLVSGITSSPTGDSAIVGCFKHQTDGTDYLLVVNKGMVSAFDFDVTLSSVADTVYRVDKTTGALVRIATNSSGFRTRSIPPGGGLLFRVVPRPRIRR